MIYLEFIDWGRSVPVDIFHHLVKQEGWEAPEDQCVINIGRHKGLGPRPAYLCAWRIRGLARMDEWEVHFKSYAGVTNHTEKATFHALDFVRCGLYDELAGGVLPDENLHFVEYFDAPPSFEDADILSHFNRRAERYPAGSLAFVLRRIGLLGPPGSDIAIWTFPDFAGVEPIAREPHATVLRPLAGGLYRNVGHELM